MYSRGGGWKRGCSDVMRSRMRDEDQAQAQAKERSTSAVKLDDESLRCNGPSVSSVRPSFSSVEKGPQHARAQAHSPDTEKG